MAEGAELKPLKNQYPNTNNDTKPPAQSPNNTTVKQPIVRKRSFIKTPSFSEYLERYENGEFDASKKPEIIFCGQQSTSKQLLIIALLFIFFVTSSIGVYTLWCTDTFEAAILQNLVLANNTAAYFMWKQPPVKTLLRVRIFNYTNIDAFLNQTEKKLRVEEVGPYVYDETLERVNVAFNGNGTVSYQEHRSYNFRPDLSKRARQHDKVIVPNVPLIGAISMVKDTYFVTRWGLNRLIKELKAPPFKVLPAHRFLWGYDDSFISLAKGVMALKNDFSMDKFGLIALRNGTSRDRITIYTGETDLNKLGLIDRFNGESHTPFWSTEECNRVDGTDGAHFPLDAIHNLEQIYVYNKEICRKLPLEYTESVMINLDNEVEMPALRYRFPKHVFSSPDIVPENQCFCHLDSGVCPPEGVFNASPCVYGLPFYPSFPHFYLADPKLIKSIDGLHPDPEKHATYLDVHPNLAFPLSGSSRIQINLQIRKSREFDSFSKFEDGTLLPVAWLEVSLGQLPPDLIDIIYHATFSAATMKTVLRFLTLIVAGITLSLLLTWLYANYTSKLYRRRLAEQIKCNFNPNQDISNIIQHRPMS